ncbi:Zinc transporter ZIP9 [Escovopsis weberi]|uniref:Zinc transporter ZIP9 n=1 Tax=Escovopsis weberi TaxID=150374 RepID=A0A0M9VU66_ESCWE|nr:Zinc transporter ZIP9 [Escovopsis weberi]
MGGLLLLVALCVVMATVSFLAGALPLSMTLTPSQMRLISSIGVGVLVGTSLIVIIPEGIEAAAAPPTEMALLHRTRSLVRRSPWTLELTTARDVTEAFPPLSAASTSTMPRSIEVRQSMSIAAAGKRRQQAHVDDDEDEGGEGEGDGGRHPAAGPLAPPDPEDDPELEEGGSCQAPTGIPTLEIGFSMTLGFVLMLLVDRLPRHATESLRPPPETRHMSLDSLGSGGALLLPADEEGEGFLGALATPSPRRARGLATTAGLVMHAAADGIAMGASATAGADVRLGLVVFVAIMLHKAPAAFGLTAVLLRQGLSKRAARGHLVIFSLAAPVGALATWCLVTLMGGRRMEGASGQWWTGMLLLFSGGTFLYVAMHAMQDDGAAQPHEHGMSSLNGYSDANAAQQRKAAGPRMRDTIATVAGILLPLLTQLGHHH